MAKFTRQEIEKALDHMDELRDRASAAGDWRIWAECLSDDVEFADMIYGTYRTRQAVADFVCRVHAPFPHLRYKRVWSMIDVDTAEVLFYQLMILPEPEGYEGEPFAVNVWSHQRYAGDNHWSLKEDVTLSRDQANETYGAWMAAGGRFEAEPLKPPSRKSSGKN